jgi:hypothetical protein
MKTGRESVKEGIGDREKRDEIVLSKQREKEK